MTLKDLVAIYNGNIIVNVSKVVTDGIEDVVTFEIEDADAIKDDVMDAPLLKFEVKVANNVKAIATIDVMI